MAHPARDANDLRPSYLAAVATSLGVLLLYVVTLSPSTAMWDASEYMAAAYTFGIPHPPGNPLFVLLGRTFAILPIAPSTAERLNLLAAVCSALSAGFWFLIAERILAQGGLGRGPRIVGGVIASVVGATAFTVWNQSVVSEKVYTISLLGLALLSWLAIRWSSKPDGAAADRILILIAYLLGLGYANHPAGMLAGPALVVLVLVRRPRTLLRPRLLATAAAALVFGLTPFLIQPIRASHHPPINMGETTACASGPRLDCLVSGTTYDRWTAHITREQYGKPSLLDRQAPFTGQLGTYWLYFEWQWLRDADGNAGALPRMLALLFLGVGLYGGYRHYRRARDSFWYLATLLFTVGPLLVWYMNFKYGFTHWRLMGNGFDGTFAEVRDRDYFFLWSFSSFGVWVGLGLTAIWETIATRLSALGATGQRTLGAPARRAWLMAAPVLVLALVPLIGNWSAASRAGDSFTRQWAADLLNSVEPYGILITNGDNDTYPLWYAQEVEGIRKDVTVAVTSLLATDWYIRQIMRRPVYEYDVARGPAIYATRSWPKPRHGPVKMSFEQVDSIPDFVRLDQPQLFKHDSIVAEIPPGFLTRDQLIVLRFIRDSFPERPVYFAASSYGQQLGLGPYLVQQGLADRLMGAPVIPSAALLPVQGAGILDVNRSHDLWTKVYGGPRDLTARDGWVDRASVDIPMRYVITGALLAEGLERGGKATDAAAVMDTVMKVASATGLSSLFAPLPPDTPAAERDRGP